MMILNGCILIPAYNEKDHIGDVIKKAKLFLPVMVVDDGSIDETATISERAGAIVFKQIPNQGKGAALQRGFKEAVQNGYDFIITMDADGQHDPEELPLFLDSFEKTHTDLIIGYRNFSQMPFIRRLANSSGGVAFSWALGQKIHDNQSGYRLMSKRLLLEVINSKETGFEYEVDVIVKCILAGYTLGWVPIKTIYATESSHIRPIPHLINFVRIVLQTRRRMRE
jgi:glycosyltransferase involved in cell wall biosynthesis